MPAEVEATTAPVVEDQDYIFDALPEAPAIPGADAVDMDVDDTPPGEPDAPEKVAPPETPAGPVPISAYLIQQAAALGVPANVAGAYKDDASLQTALNHAVAMRASTIGQPSTAPAPQPQPTVEPGAPKAFNFDTSAYTAENFDEGVVNLVGNISAMNKHYASQAEAMHQTLTDLQDKLQKTIAQSQRREFDGFIGHLGAEWKGLLGEGPSLRLNQGSAEFRNRSQFWNEARTRAAMHQQLNLPELPMEELFEQALHSSFHNRQAELARGKLKADVEQQKGQAMVKPVGRRKAPPQVKDRLADAVAAATKGMQKIGMIPMLE